MKISIGNDHAGPEYKKAIVEMLKAKGHEVTNYGTDSEDSVDYPDFGHPVANDVESGKADFGIVICGSGNGINMTVNKHQGIRAALCWTKEISALARQHNNANVVSIPARFTLMAMISVGHPVSESAIPEDLLARETAERSRRALGELFYQGAWANPIK